MLAAAAYREAMSHLGAAVSIVATDGPSGRHGFTASSVCSVTDSPPTLLVCLNRAGVPVDEFLANGVLSVSVLAGVHETLSNLFAGDSAMPVRFASGVWREGATGAPRLADAAVAFDCRIGESKAVGTHSVLFCDVEAVSLGAGPEGLFYFRRAYHRLG